MQGQEDRGFHKEANIEFLDICARQIPRAELHHLKNIIHLHRHISMRLDSTGN